MTEDDDYHYTFENSVRLEETDAQGVVFYGNYVTFQDEATLAYWREIGFPYERILETDWEVFIVHVDMDYYASARFGDTLRNGVRVSLIGDSSLTFDYRCERVDDGALLAEGTVVQVAVGEDGETRSIPDEVTQAIVEYQDVAPEMR